MTKDDIEALREVMQQKPGSAFERHAQTLLTTLVALLLAGVTAFIFQIKDSQSAQLTEIRVLQVQVSALNADLRSNDNHMADEVEEIKQELSRLEDYLNRMWARLRNANENIVILHRNQEASTGNKIDLQEPDPY